MKIVAMVTSFGCQGQASDDTALLTVVYSCGNRQFDSGVECTIDLTQTEDAVKDSIKTSVSAAVNAALGLSTTAADVRLL